MGMLENISKFVYDRTKDFQDVYNAAKPQLQGGTYALDQLFKDSVKLWVKGVDAASQFFPYLPPDTVPVSYKMVGAGAGFFNEFVNPGYFPFGAKLEDTGLIALNGGTASAAQATYQPQPDGTLLVDIQSLKGQKAGEIYQEIIFYLDDAKKVHPVVVLEIRVT